MCIIYLFQGLAISFISTDEDAKRLAEVQSRFEVRIPELPDTIETSLYSKYIRQHTSECCHATDTLRQAFVA